MAAKSRIPIARPDIGRAERLNVNEVMRSGWITQGKFVAEAEERLKAITGRKYAICCSSGTMALMVALLDTNIKPHRLVAAPAMTFAAVHNAIRLTGGDVWHQDAYPATWQAYTPKGCTFDYAVVAPCYGKVVAADLDLRSSVRCEMIEDAAESFGGSYESRPAGSGYPGSFYCSVSVVSFYANKIVTAGEGGAILCNSEEMYTRMRLIVNHGIADKSYVPVLDGLNARMTDLQAAVLCAQLERMPKMLRRRREILKRYRDAGVGRWTYPRIEPTEECAPWLFAGIPANRDAAIDACDRENIECRPFFPMPRGFAGRAARSISERGLCLPLSSALTDAEVERICNVIREA
jgi:perosamine synthetase